MPGSVPSEDRGAGGWREIRHYAYVERPFDETWALLARSPVEVLAGDREAPGAPEASLHVKRAGMEMSRDVRLRFSGLVCDEHRARLSLRWEDAHHPRLFPVLEAVLELAPLKSGRLQVTQIGLVGRYRPPFGNLGGLADRLAGVDVAAESVAHFVEEVARRLADLIPEPPLPDADRDFIRPLEGPGRRRVFMPLDGLDDQPGGAACVGRYLEAAPGVLRAEVHPLAGLATIEYDPELCNPTKLLEDLESDRAWFDDHAEVEEGPIPGSDV